MTDTLLLKKKIKESGFKLGYLAHKMKLSRQSLSKKINNHTKFTTTEMYILSELLSLTNDEMRSIFFKDIVA